MEDGENIIVTQENKSLYVEKYVEYVFQKSCETPYKAFEKGFLQVCGGYSLKLFQPSELQVCFSSDLYSIHNGFYLHLYINIS